MISSDVLVISSCLVKVMSVVLEMENSTVHVNETCVWKELAISCGWELGISAALVMETCVGG